MLGNDIIDISQTKRSSNWKRKGFLQKAFSPEEQGKITSSADPFATLWRMWSMKESAYKLYLQQGHARFFNPASISCDIISAKKGVVCIRDWDIKTQTEINSDYIFTIAALGDWDRVENSIFHLSSRDAHFQSATTHQKIRHHIAAKNRLEIDQLHIRKTSTHIPQLFYQGQKLALAISLTHHGHYGAFSVLNSGKITLTSLSVPSFCQ